MKQTFAPSALLLVVLVALQELEQTTVDAFVSPSSSRAFSGKQQEITYDVGTPRRTTHCNLFDSPLYDRLDDDEEDDDDDDMIDPNSLGDWRTFRRNLALTTTASENDSRAVLIEQEQRVITSVSKENEELLRNQNKALAEEYKQGVWAHPVSTPEVGGLLVRMPIEVELVRNYRHSIMGNKLRQLYASDLNVHDQKAWYQKAQKLMEDEMYEIASTADDNGQIDSSTLSDESTEMLQIFLDHQDTWQEVCLVLEHYSDDMNDNDGNNDNLAGQAKTLVLNRPMAFKLTENLSRLVLYGAYQSTSTRDGHSVISQQQQPNAVNNRNHPHQHIQLDRFMEAFGNECAVYVGGTDDQDQPAILIHGIRDLPGAREISPGTGIYEGGLEAAINGVLAGKYNPLDFRFFVGCHQYDESALDVAVVLGKYQPIACARSLVLKQCMSLPKPLWHEVLELCGGEMDEVSSLEMLKRDDILFQIIDDDDDEEDIFGELRVEEDDDDDDNYYI